MKKEIEIPEEKNVQMVIYKENIFISFFNKIKKLFKRK